MNTDRLFQRLSSERYNEFEGSEQDQRDRRMFNAGSVHAEKLVREFLQTERIEAGLRELVQAPALDLRLRNQLCEMQESLF